MFTDENIAKHGVGTLTDEGAQYWLDAHFALLAIDFRATLDIRRA